VLLVAASMGGSYAMPYIVHEPSSVVGFVPIGAIGSEDYMTQLHAMPDRLAFPVRAGLPRRECNTFSALGTRPGSADGVIRT